MKGFTLLEILIALLISTIILILTFTGLQSLIQIRHKLSHTNQRLSALQSTFWHCQQDFSQFQIAHFIDPHNDPMPSFLLQPNSLVLITAQIPQFHVPYPNTGLLQVEYKVENGTLYRIAYPIENQAFAAIPVKEPLIHNVKKLSLLALDAHNQWQNNFAVNTQNSNTLLPKAIDVIIYYNNTQVHRIFPLFNPLITGGRDAATD